MAPRSKRPRSNPNATCAETIEAIVRLRTDLLAQRLDAGPHTLRSILPRDRPHAPIPSATTIWRVLTSAGLVTAAPRTRPQRRYGGCRRPPQQVLAADFTRWTPPGGTGAEILTCFHDHSATPSASPLTGS